jgi:hypothetical protein
LTFFEPQTEFTEDAPQVHGAGPHALFGRFPLQLDEYDVGLRLDQPPDQIRIDPALGSTLRGAPMSATAPLAGGNFTHPTVAHIKPRGKRLQGALASRVRRQHLQPKIIAIWSRHPLTISQTKPAAKNQALYPQVKWSSLFVVIPEGNLLLHWLLLPLLQRQRRDNITA